MSAPSDTELSAAYRAVHLRAERDTGRKGIQTGAWADAGAALLAEMTADRDRLAAEVERLNERLCSKPPTTRLGPEGPGLGELDAERSCPDHAYPSMHCKRCFFGGAADS